MPTHPQRVTPFVEFLYLFHLCQWSGFSTKPIVVKGERWTKAQSSGTRRKAWTFSERGDCWIWITLSMHQTVELHHDFKAPGGMDMKKKEEVVVVAGVETRKRWGDQLLRDGGDYRLNAQKETDKINQSRDKLTKRDERWLTELRSQGDCWTCLVCALAIEQD